MSKIIIAAAALLAFSSPVSARSIGERIDDMPDEAWVGVGFIAADHAATGYCSNNGTCVEKGPIIKALCGKHPKPLCLAGAFAGKTIFSLTAISLVQDSNPMLARDISIGFAIGNAASFGLTAKVAF